MPNNKPTKPMVDAKATIDAEVKKQLGDSTKVIFDKLDEMLKQGKTREEIEATLTPQISQCIDDTFNSRILFVT